MNKALTVFLISIFILLGCGGTPDTPEEIIEETIIEKDINTFVSPNHGTIGIFPTYKYLGMKENSEGIYIRRYHVWEQKRERKYIIIIQMVPKEGEFSKYKKWVPANNALFVKGMRSAYTKTTPKTKRYMEDMGAQFPECFIVAQEAHVLPTEAIIRILIVPDKMCLWNYESVMEELDRTAIINPLG